MKTAVCAIFFCLLLLPGGTLGQTVLPEPDDANLTSVTARTTQEAVSCPAADRCNTAAAVVGSLIAGCLIGAVVTCCVQSVLRRRKQRMPPKDYTVTESRRYDVNRNSDGSVHITSAQTRVKEHKKLERLVKMSQTSPGDTVTAPAETPLIPSVSSTVEPEPTTNNPSTPSHTGRSAAEQNPTYANIGAMSTLANPYDTLDIIPEESEYENFRSSLSEGILVEADAK